MIRTDLSALIGALFVVLAGGNVWLMFLRMGPERTGPRAMRLTQAHRAGGYLYLALYLVMFYFMLQRVQDAPDELAPRALIHMILGLALAPLLFLKIVIARSFKNQSQYLTPLGFLLFSLSFVLVGMTAGPYWMRRAPVETVSLPSVGLSAEPIDVSEAAALMRVRCGRCHNLDRIIGARKDAAGWLATVNRMQALPGSGISAADARTIFAYLAKVLATDSAPRSGQPPAAAPAAAASLAAGERGAGLPPTGRTGQRTALPANRDSSPDLTTGTVIVGALGLSMLLFWRRGASGMGRQAEELGAREAGGGGGRDGASPVVDLPVPSDRSVPVSAPLTLTLARIISETPGVKTFRFLLPEGAAVKHRAGQFLTFEWVVEGRKVPRCYSISSSPAQSHHHLDITVKRVPGGAVSGYLHDHAVVGLTVSARPPAGRFVLPDPPPRRLLCLAGGSGITPVMSLLRWIDDACLPIEVTLIYSVRTAVEIIFGPELKRLTMSVPGLKVMVTLTQPPDGWDGERGRLSREMIERCCPDLEEIIAYVCGPGPFMDAARALLDECGVPSDRIRQESFGKPPRPDAPAEPTAAERLVGPRVEFARSGKSCTVPEDCPLLEAAEQCGVVIPSACRQGQCGTCATRLLAGEVRMEAEDGLDPELRRQGYVLTCVGHVRGNVRLDA